MNAGVRVRVKRWPKLTGVVKLGTHHVTYTNDEGVQFTPKEPRVCVTWDPQHGTPETTTIREDLVEVVV